jgi:GT2 family glycosyltransferase
VTPPTARQPVRLSVVTVFWNGREMARAWARSIEAARRALPFPVEVIAVDNASSDGTADMLEAEFPAVRVVRNAANVGFAPACNQGLALATGSALLLLNPDCEPDAAALRGLVRLLARHPEVGAAGCELLHEDGLPQHSHHREPSWWSYWGTHSLLSPLILRADKALHPVGARQRRRPVRVGWLMGACLMMSRRAYEAVGGLDPAYFMYSEDADWCRRAREAGFAIVFDPRHRMLHRHGTSAARRPEFTFRRLYRSLLMYTRKHHRGLAGVAMRLAVITDLVARLPIYIVTAQFERVGSVLRLLAMYAANNPGLFPDAPPALGRSK